MRKKKNYGRTVHCKLPLLNPVSKWVRSDSNGWSFNLGVYCLLWKRFCVLNVALRMTKKLNRLRNSDGYVLVFKKTQRVVWPCFNCVDFMAQTVSAYSSAHKWFWLKKNNHRNAPWKMTDTDWTISLPKRRYFNAFMKNARLWYEGYSRVRLFEKASEISAFWVVHGLSVVFLGEDKARERLNTLPYMPWA